MTTKTIVVNGTEYTWYQYSEPLQILNADDVNNAQSNISVIKDILTSKGYTLSDLQSEPASYDSELVKIIDILNAVEYNLDIINDTIAKSAYYGESYRATYDKPAHNTEEIWRWFKSLEDAKSIVTGQKGRWGTLICNNGYPTINGKRILTRGDLIG